MGDRSECLASSPEWSRKRTLQFLNGRFALTHESESLFHHELVSVFLQCGAHEFQFRSLEQHLAGFIADDDQLVNGGSSAVAQTVALGAGLRRFFTRLRLNRSRLTVEEDFFGGAHRFERFDRRSVRLFAVLAKFTDQTLTQDGFDLLRPLFRVALRGLNTQKGFSRVFRPGGRDDQTVFTVLCVFIFIYQKLMLVT